MKYEQPYGVSDPNASYINGNPAAGIQGSIPPAAAFENPMRELVAMIAGGGFTPSDSDLQQLLRAVRSQYLNYCVDQGTLANNYTTSFNPAITAYLPGMIFRLYVANTNTGASSFDAGAGRHPVKRYGGADPSAGDMPAQSIAELVWNAAQARFELMNYAGAGGTGGGPSVTVSGLINIQVFTASGTYTPTTGATKAVPIITGAGGAGAQYCGGAGGGGAGATALGLVPLAGVPTVPVTIGAGAIGVFGNANGGTGGISSFGTFAVANGGVGGTQFLGGRGGLAPTGLVHIPGGDGMSMANTSNAGHGGASFWGGGAAAGVDGNSTSQNSQTPGSGGPGYSGPNPLVNASGNGANGICVVLEF